MEMLEQFLRQQPVVWNKLTKHFPSQEVATVIREYNKRIDRGESILTIMRKGFTISGAKVKFCQFKPVLEGEGTDNYRLYRANRFSVVRQMRYSLGKDSGNELDLCILLNGIPLFTFELKTKVLTRTIRMAYCSTSETVTHITECCEAVWFTLSWIISMPS